MKIQTLSLLAAGSTCIFSGPQVSAQITGISVASKPNELGLLVCNVYAEFEEPGVGLIAIGGAPFVTTYTVIDGTFYQNPFGSDGPPNPALFSIFPSLRYDTFVSIGVKSFNLSNPGVPEGQPEDNLTFAPQWPNFGPSSLVLEGTAYHVWNTSLQLDPFDPAFVRGDGGILIGQFSTEDGTGFTGDVEFHFLGTGNPYQSQILSFVHTVDKACFDVLTEQTICHDNGFTFAVDGVESCSGSVFSFSFSAAGGAVGQEMCFSVVVNDGQGQECCAVELCTTIPDCSQQAAVPFDLNGDGTVGMPDMLELLGAWGSCGSCYTPWTCPADFDSDCAVGILDFLALLGNWS